MTNCYVGFGLSPGHTGRADAWCCCLLQVSRCVRLGPERVIVQIFGRSKPTSVPLRVQKEGRGRQSWSPCRAARTARRSARGQCAGWGSAPPARHSACTPAHSTARSPLVVLLPHWAKYICEEDSIVEWISYLERHSRRGKRSLSSSFRTFHFCMRGGISRLMYSGLFRWWPTLSASVPMASYLSKILMQKVYTIKNEVTYKINRFLCWYLLNAKTRVSRMKPR